MTVGELRSALDKYADDMEVFDTIDLPLSFIFWVPPKEGDHNKGKIIFTFGAMP